MLGLAPATAVGQETFTQQIILIPPFESADERLGGSIADRLRGKVKAYYKRRVATVIDKYDMELLLESSSIKLSELDGGHLKVMAQQMRADEILSGTIERRGTTGVRVRARLALVRDARMVQQLPPIDAPSVDSAATLVAQEIERVRRQLVPQRHCENATWDGKIDEAIKQGRAIAKTLPRAALLRGCVVRAQVATGADARELLEEANNILREEPQSYWGLDAAARAHDALGDKPKAAEAWLQLAETDSTDVKLARRVVESFINGGNTSAAKPLVVRVSDANPADMELLRLRWQVQFTLRDWAGAVTTGDRLALEDAASRGDSTFTFRLATAHRAKGDTVKAVAIAADGVSRFPKDARLYLIYSDLVQGDARVAVARGLERFPDLAELHVLRAQELRREGKTADAVASMQRATAIDTAFSAGHLALAQMQVDLGQLDSALVSVRAALAAGEEAASVAAFALARGNALYRAANGTKQRADYQLALQYLTLADSVNGSPQSHFLVGVTALSISQNAAQEAPETKACALSQLAGSLLPLAREKITSGAQVAPDAARQYLTYLDQLDPVVTAQMAALCSQGVLELH
jgi:tetratricopeptide (TPR) repeat protein